ncbi:MAG: NADH-quinone oxidoreductase subunit M [Myxococcales bacterium]|nr:MAG: NADH-quinone oxidoreductase subunit M [Myxococcales bacterium]
MIPHLLSVLLALPLLGAVALLFFPRQSPGAVRVFSLALLLLEFVISVAGLLCDPKVVFGADYQLIEQIEWIPSLGIAYKLGIDGISLWLVLLTTLLTPIALYSSWSSVNTKVKEYAIAFLLLQVGMLGAFVALDLFLFYVFWELMLVPMYLIIGIWGGPRRVYAAVKFFLYTMVGSLLMLVAILYTVMQYKALAGHYSFDIQELTRLVLPVGAQYWLFIAFALAFAIKVPLFPFHTWLPDAHVEAPTGGSIILAAVLLKLGGYGFIRFALPLFPYAAHKLAPMFLAQFAVVGIIYGAYCAWVQKDVKKLVAYSSVSHLGFVMLGIFSMNAQGISGAILQMVSHGISTGALFLLVGVIYDRRHTRELDEFGGLAKVMPVYATLFVIITMSSVGLPGTNGFVGEFMILASTFVSGFGGAAGLPWPRTFAALAATGVILAAIYMLHAVLKMFWGPLSNPKNQELPDVSRRELRALLPLVVFVFWIGLFPKTFLDSMEPSVGRFVKEYNAKLIAIYNDDSARLLEAFPAVQPEPEAMPEAPAAAAVSALSPKSDSLSRARVEAARALRRARAGAARALPGDAS